MYKMYKNNLKRANITNFNSNIHVLTECTSCVQFGIRNKVTYLYLTIIPNLKLLEQVCFTPALNGQELNRWCISVFNVPDEWPGYVQSLRRKIEFKERVLFLEHLQVLNCGARSLSYNGYSIYRRMQICRIKTSDDTCT